jgi:hypothetical protein
MSDEGWAAGRQFKLKFKLKLGAMGRLMRDGGWFFLLDASLSKQSQKG